LFGAEIRRRKDLLHAEDLYALFRSLLDKVQVFLNVEPLDLFDGEIRGGRIGTLY
jgi:hypothetical protein